MKRIALLNVDVISQRDLDRRIHMANRVFHFNMLDIDCTQGACKGSACPVNFSDEDTEYSQNMGCLPAPSDIIQMRAVEGVTWACHSDYTKPCVSGVRLLQALNLPYKVLQLRNEMDMW